MKKILLASCALLAVHSALALMEPATPESQGIPSAAILRFVDACERTFDAGPRGAIHGFVIVRHGKVIAEGSWRPFDTLNETHMLYSHSKNFTSSAIGFLADEGRIDLDERIVDIFSNEVPAKVSENLAQLRVRDLLTMNVGKSDHLLQDDGDWVGEFLSSDFVRRPGTAFKYDSDATYMLAVIAERRSGERMMDYLKRKMFDKIGITQAWTTYSPQGIPCGGWGMNMTTREIARFGQLYLDRGKWNGEQVLSPFWVDLATARHTWSGASNADIRSLDARGDKEQGYGFQFWRCRHGAYRADGSKGQCTVVLPEQDMVVSIHAGQGGVEMELDLIWEHLLPAVKDAPLAEDSVAQKALAERLAKLEIPPVSCRGTRPSEWRRRFDLEDGPRGFKSVAFELADDGVRCTLVTRAGEQRFPAGFGKWLKGAVRIDPENYEWLGAFIGEQKTAASCGFDEDGAFRLRAYLTGTPAYFEFNFRDGKIESRFWPLRSRRRILANQKQTKERMS